MKLLMVKSTDSLQYNTEWEVEKWSEEACDFARKRLSNLGVTKVLDGYKSVPTNRVNKVMSALLGKPVVEYHLTPNFITIEHGITSEMLRRHVGRAEVVDHVKGNLLLNEGIALLEDLLIGAGGVTYANGTAGIGVGDTATAEAATQTELQATNNAANRFYKAMVATWPQRSSQTVSWRSDFTTTEANFVWNEWTIANAMTTASGSGFLVGTLNLNRKVASLGTKTTGTWTMTGQVTIS